MFSPTPFGRYISVDGFHPADAGHTVLAQAAARALNATYDMGIPLEVAARGTVGNGPRAELPAEAFEHRFGGDGEASAGPPMRGVVQSASGHGNLTINGALRTFSFTAIREADGEVKGEFELKNHGTGSRMHGDVTCFFAFPRPGDPDRGAMFAAGVVTQSDDGFPVGTPVIFNAFDNGEGANALFPDFLSLMGAATPEAVQRQCAFGLRIEPVLPIEGGNIQIRP
jgi:hypothetical protein